ncbi:MAG: YihY/virulence factor BrkB family protein [Lawsonibacter sp.]|jgi:membrane protein|nr:YihY/virulence factor BrkB family protein [Lawsonibacter sp.]MCI9026767.1 YihY/virulence factor BrkB family protein [Lawsonibacter sp.]MCI9655663.1 YihY/virulence factor BrkB family protein [Lawsonibacter sp.]
MKKILSFPPVSFGVKAAELYLEIGAPRAAAALSYFLILTLFPLLVCVNYFIGLFHLDLENLLLSLDQFLPDEVLLVMRDYLGYVAGSQSRALLLASLVTILISASAGLRTLLAAMDGLHGVKNTHAVRRVVLSVALSALFLLTIYLSVVVIFTGEWFFWLLEERLPRRIAELIPPLSGLWRWMRYLLLFCFVLLLVLIVYRAGTPRGAMGRRVVVLASLLAALAIVAASALFSWFIGMSSRYALVYGSLASLIILLVWLYLCGNILLLGAVIGRVLEDRR